jgi:hypothetical protein
MRVKGSVWWVSKGETSIAEFRVEIRDGADQIRQRIPFLRVNRGAGNADSSRQEAGHDASQLYHPCVYPLSTCLILPSQGAPQSGLNASPTPREG